MVVTCPSCSTANRLPAARLHQTARCGHCKAELLPLAKPIAVESGEDFAELVADSPLPVVVDFWAAWCGPCRAVAPQIEQVARRGVGKVVVAKLDTDALPDVAGRHRIQGIPTMVLFQGGAEAKRISGAMPADAIVRSLGLAV